MAIFPCLSSQNSQEFQNVTMAYKNQPNPSMRTKPLEAKSSDGNNGHGVGRPGRTDNPQRITLYLALETKRKAYEIATNRGCSISQIVEELIEECEV